MKQDIIAYHHTSEENKDKIMCMGFKLECLNKISIGFGIQCFLEETDSPVFNNDCHEGQIQVEFKNCNVLDNSMEVEKSTNKIIMANENDRRSVAISEANRLISLGFDAYIKPYSRYKAIVFLKPPTPVEWIPYQKTLINEDV